MTGEDRPVSCRRWRLGRGFARRAIRLAPGATRGYRESDWRDAIVLVEHGCVELEDDRRTRQRFGPGAVLTLAGARVRVLRNPGTQDVLLVAVRRRRGLFAQVRRFSRRNR